MVSCSDLSRILRHTRVFQPGHILSKYNHTDMSQITPSYCQWSHKITRSKAELELALMQSSLNIECPGGAEPPARQATASPPIDHLLPLAILVFPTQTAHAVPASTQISEHVLMRQMLRQRTDTDPMGEPSGDRIGVDRMGAEGGSLVEEGVVIS